MTGAAAAEHLRVVEPDEERPACDLIAEKIVACGVTENTVGADAPRILEVMHIVAVEDFFDPSFRSMFRAALEVHQRGETPTPNAVLAVLERHYPMLGAARENFFEALRTAPEERNLAARAQTIRELSRRRASAQLAGEVSVRLRSRSEAPTEQIIGETVAKLEAIAADLRPEDRVTRATAAQAAVARVLDPAPKRISTGLPGVDEIQMGGVAIGQTTWLGAERGTGKSAMAGYIAHHAAESGYPTVVVSGEMPPHEFLSRMACERAGLDSRALDGRRGISADTIGRYTEAVTAISKLPLIIIGGPSSDIGRTVPSIRQELRRVSAEIGRPRLLVVDYLQRMKVDHSSRVRPDEQLSEHGWGLMQLAESCALGVLGIVQLNAEKRIKDCRKLEDHAHTFWQLRRVARSKASWAPAGDDHIELLELWVEKARHADQHVATPLEFDKRIMRFTDARRVGE